MNVALVESLKTSFSLFAASTGDTFTVNTALISANFYIKQYFEKKVHKVI